MSKDTIDYVSLRELASGEVLSLIIGESGTDGFERSNVSALSGITSEVLEKEYGYSPQEALNTMNMLNLMQVPVGRETYYHKELESKVKQAVRSSSGNGNLWEALTQELGSRSDTVYNIANHAGLNSFMHTGSYVRSGMTPANLSQYVTRMQRSNKGVNRNKNTPVYVRDVESSVKSDDSIIDGGWNQSIASADGSPVILRRAGITNADVKPSSTQNINDNVLPNAKELSKSSIPEEITSFTDYSVGGKYMSQSNKQAADPETIRLRRIEEEYLKEKAEWEKKKQPVLARSATHDLGHAEGTIDDSLDMQKVSKEIGHDVLKTLKRR